MDSHFGTDSHVPLHREVSAERHQAVMDALAAEQVERAKSLGKQTDGVRAATQASRQQLQKMLGKSNYSRFLDFMAEQKASAVARRFPPKDVPMSTDEIQEVAEQRARAAKDFLKKLGITLDQFNALNAQANKAFAKTRPSFPQRQRKPVLLVRPEDVPQDVRAYKTNPWTIMTPPYQGWNKYWYYWVRNFVIDEFVNHVDVIHTTGMLNNDLNLYDNQTVDVWHDHDTASGKHYGAIGFWYQMPSEGQVEAWIEAECNENRHHMWFGESWPWSDVSFDQQNYLTLKVEPMPDESKALTTHMYGELIGRSDTWDYSWITNGDVWWVHLFSSSTHQKDAWVWVQVGNFNELNAFARFSSADCAMHFRWTIKSVHVHSTGDND